MSFCCTGATSDGIPSGGLTSAFQYGIVAKLVFGVDSCFTVKCRAAIILEQFADLSMVEISPLLLHQPGSNFVNAEGPRPSRLQAAILPRISAAMP